MYNIQNYGKQHSKKIGVLMATTPEIAIFVFCLIGCGLTSYFVGRQTGIEATVQHFIDVGILIVDEEHGDE